MVWKNLEVNKKVVPLHSHLKNGCLKRQEFFGKTEAKNKNLKIFEKRFGD